MRNDKEGGIREGWMLDWFKWVQANGSRGGEFYKTEDFISCA